MANTMPYEDVNSHRWSAKQSHSMTERRHLRRHDGGEPSGVYSSCEPQRPIFGKTTAVFKIYVVSIFLIRVG